MLKSVIRALVALALIAPTPAIVQAQDEFAEMQRSQEELDQMFSAMSEFIGEVRFDEDDIRSLIDHWQEWDALESDSGDDEDDDIIDFKAILKDSAYREWAASLGLDADDWMRKTLRITMALYRDQMMMAAESMPAQMAQQLEMIEQQRAQLGEELYQQMKQGMEAAAQYGKAVMDSARKLPEPTPEERALLERYRDELAMILDSGDDEYGNEDNYDDEYYDDEYEEGDEE
jgi:hypothetical protein